MSQEASIRDIVYSIFRESKKFEKKGRLEEALSVIESLQDFSSNAHSSLSGKIVERGAYLCSKLSTSSEHFAHYCRKAETILKDWVTLCRANKVPVQERIIHLYTSTLNNWAVYQQRLNNYHLALSYLMKAIKILEKSPSQDIEIVAMIAKTRHNISSLYIELRRYKEAIVQGEMALVFLQRESKVRRLIGNDEKLKENICTYLSVFYNIGFSEGALGDIQKMKDTYYKAIEISSHILPNDHPQVAMIRDALQATSKVRNMKRSYSFNKSIQDHALDKVPKAPSPEKSPVRRTIIKKRTVSNANLADLKSSKRYYTNDQLEHIQKQISETNHIKFVSADQFFFAKIQKQLNLDDDVKSIQPKNHEVIAKQDCEFKRKMNELRLRRHCRNFKYETKGLDYLKERIDVLKRDDESVPVKHRIRTKSLNKIEAPKTTNIRTFTEGNQYQQAKEEIEELMENINAEIKGINHKTQRNGKNKVSLLAESALSKVSTLKKSLKVTLRNK